MAREKNPNKRNILRIIIDEKEVSRISVIFKLLSDYYEIAKEMLGFYEKERIDIDKKNFIYKFKSYLDYFKKIMGNFEVKEKEREVI